MRYYIVMFGKDTTFSEARSKAMARITDARMPIAPLMYVNTRGDLDKSSLSAQDFSLTGARKELKDWRDSWYGKNYRFAIIDENYKMVR